ncbi:rod-binding protein [Thalassobaculum sp. OXR-137]|uniref:rod-binding protein n=1 Tax=Thalassobaculum sp. OXR-137 TaxID=3100173 RepID=UPI002AC9BA09|nr:rod-binding protein [Thalassobaculum sp. OXR-137]WPZ34168.1 rod-binding protein [Thalassobaculum sp. OXR-137]
MTATLSMANLGTADLAMARGRSATANTAAEIQAAARAKDKQAVRATAEKFEAQFLSQMMGHMFKGITGDSVMGGGHAEEMWRDFYVEEVTKTFATRGGIGLADTIEKQLLQLQEAV